MNYQVFIQIPLLPDIEDVDDKSLLPVGGFADQTHVLFIGKIAETSGVQNCLADREILPRRNFITTGVAHLARHINLAVDPRFIDYFDSEDHRRLIIELSLQQCSDLPGELPAGLARCVNESV